MGSMMRESVTVVVIGSKETKYKGGRCSCGLMIMSRLGITLADKAQHEWRRALAKGQFPPDRKVEVRCKIAVYC